MYITLKQRSHILKHYLRNAAETGFQNIIACKQIKVFIE